MTVPLFSEVRMNFEYVNFCVRLNEELTQLTKKGISAIPISNLEIPIPNMRKQEIVDLLIRDGIKAVLYEFTDGSEIYVQIP